MTPTSVRGRAAARCLRFFLLIGLAIPTAVGTNYAQVPRSAQTIWQFWRNYRGPDKITRLLNSYSVGNINGCTGTMISPHIMVSAAHCGGGPKIVQFFYMDEDVARVAPQFQAKSQEYFARSFNWQGFMSRTGVQDSDFMLYWLENGSDGIPPGIKHGYLELNPSSVRVGDSAYVFWRNPLIWDPNNPGNTFDTLYHTVGSAVSLGDLRNNNGPLHFTNYSIATVPGASGSSIVSATEHSIIGISAIPGRAADTAYILSLHDGDENSVLDAVEQDLLTTESPRNFRLLTFATPLQRAQWRPFWGSNGQVTLAKPVLVGVPIGQQPANWLGLVGGFRVEPFWFRGCWNSVWNRVDPVDGRCPPRFLYFDEDFEDGQLSTPGVRASAGQVSNPGPFTDSVDCDDLNCDHSGTAGRSFRSANGPAGITFTFEGWQLLALPTRAGIVWTDGAGETSFEAFDALGGSLGVIGPVKIADDSFQGTAADDRFFGFVNAGGISAIKIWNSSGPIEVDHLQYDYTPIPAMGEDLSNPNARFRAGSRFFAGSGTYRVMAQVYGWTSIASGTIRFESAKGGATQTINFRTGPLIGVWTDVSGRVTLLEKDDYRLVLGTPSASAYYVRHIAIVHEGSPLNFQTGEERSSWEYVGGAHPTTWGVNGPGDFSGVVVGPSPANGWSLRQQYIALESNRNYEITCDVKHVRGGLTVTDFMRIEDRSGVRAGETTWQFAQIGQTQTLSLVVNAGNSSTSALVFGSNGEATYMVDNIRISLRP